jgi:PAS domain S-box-containing protein
LDFKIFDYLDSIVICFTIDGEIAYCAGNTLSRLNYTKESVLGLNFPDLLWDSLSYEILIENILEHTEYSTSLLIRSVDNSTFTCDAVFVNDKIDSGYIQCVLKNIASVHVETLNDNTLNLENVFDNVPNHVFWKGKDLRYAGCNTSFANFAGLSSPDDIIGKLDEDIFGFNLSKVMSAGDSALISGATKDFKSVDYVEISKGENIWLDISKKTLISTDGAISGFVCTITNIDREVQAQLALQQRVWLEGSLMNLSKNFINMPLSEIDDGIEEALKEVGKLLDLDRAYVFSVNYSDGSCCNLYEWCGADVVPFKNRMQRLPLDEMTSISEALVGKKVISVSDIKKAKNISETELHIFEDKGCSAFVIVPLILKNKFNGFVGFDSKTVREWDNDTINILQVVGEVILNVSGRKILGEELHRTQLELETLFNAIPAYIYIKNRDFRYVRVNQTSADIAGLNIDDFNGLTDYDIFPKERADINRNVDEYIFDTGKGVFNKVATYEVNGKKVYISTNKVPFRNIEGDISGIIGVSVDVTQQIEAEAGLKEREARLNILMSQVPAMLWAIETDYKLTSITGRLMLNMGINPERTVGQSIDIIPLMKEDSLFEKAHKHALNGKPFSYELNALGRDLHIGLEPIKGDGGLVTGAIGVAVDITEQKKTRLALKESEVRYKSLVDNLTIGIAVVNQDMKILSSNVKFKEFFPRQKYSMIYDYSKKLALQNSNDPTIECNVIKTFKDAGTYNSLQDHMLGEREVFFKTTTVPVLDNDRKVVAAIEIYDDVTENIIRERLLQDRQRELLALNNEMEDRVRDEVRENIEKTRLLTHQSRLAAMGEMIGNIAHQWRQPLNSLSLVIFDMKFAHTKKLLNDEKIDDIVTKVETLVHKMSATIDDFRNFFKLNKDKEMFNLAESINNTIELVKDTYANNNIEFQLDLDDSLTAVGYPNEYSQVILNMISNAKDAFVDNAVVDSVIKIKLFSSDDKAVLEIEDNAGGIPAEVLSRVFEPYFTTKSEGQGTGIGLYMSKMIVENSMQGELTVKNIKEGASFRIEIDKCREMI